MRKHPDRFIGIGLLLFVIGIVLNIALALLAMIESLPEISSGYVRHNIPYIADNAVRLFGLTGVVIFILVKYLNKKSAAHWGTVLTVVSSGAIVMYFWRMFIQCYKVYTFVSDDVVFSTGSSLKTFFSDNCLLEVIGLVVILLGSIGMLLKREEEAGL